MLTSEIKNMYLENLSNIDDRVGLSGFEIPGFITVSKNIMRFSNVPMFTCYQNTKLIFITT